MEKKEPEAFSAFAPTRNPTQIPPWLPHAEAHSTSTLGGEFYGNSVGILWESCGIPT